jgi:hypothetical protein
LVIDSQSEWVIFVDGESDNFDVFAIGASGTLSNDTTYKDVGTLADPGNFIRSPNNDYLYVVSESNYSDNLETLLFDESTGVPSVSTCPLITLNGGSTLWTNTGQMAVATNTGTGTDVFVAETDQGYSNYVAMVAVSSSGCLSEVSGSPIANSSDTKAAWTLSSYPGSPSQ